MRVGLFLGDLAFVDQPLHERMVDRALHHLGAAEVVDARIAGMDDVASQVRARCRRRPRVLCGSSSAVIAVSLIIRCDFEHQLAQHLGGVVLAGHEALEELARGQQHLVGGLAPAALAAHAVGQHRQHAAADARVRDEFDLVLLVGAVAAVEAGGGAETEGLGERRACGRI